MSAQRRRPSPDPLPIWLICLLGVVMALAGMALGSFLDLGVLP